MEGLLLRERLYCRCFVVFHVENGVKLRDLQQGMNLLGQVQQLQLAALIADGRECTDQLTNP